MHLDWSRDATARCSSCYFLWHNHHKLIGYYEAGTSLFARKQAWVGLELLPPSCHLLKRDMGETCVSTMPACPFNAACMPSSSTCWPRLACPYNLHLRDIAECGCAETPLRMPEMPDGGRRQKGAILNVIVWLLTSLYCKIVLALHHDDAQAEATLVDPDVCLSRSYAYCAAIHDKFLASSGQHCSSQTGNCRALKVKWVFNRFWVTFMLK